MNSSPRANGRRHHGGAGSVEIGEDQVTIRLPDPRVLRLVARSFLFTAAIVSLPWLRTMLITDAGKVAVLDDAPASSSPTPIRWVDDPYFLPMLVRDLRREGLLAEEGRGIFLGDPCSRLPFLKRNNVEAAATEEQRKTIGERSVDFVIAADGLYDVSSRAFVERVLRTGGVAAFSLSSDPSQIFRLPRNYMMVYVRQFGSAIVGIKKMSHAAGHGGNDGVNAADSMGIRSVRRLLGIPQAMKQKKTVHGHEDALLEPPPETMRHEKLRRRVKYLPDMTGDALSNYPRRMFADVVREAGRGGSGDWLEQQYPKCTRAFEIVRQDVLEKEKTATGAATGATTVGLSQWLRKNVRKEEYVGTKANVAETGAIALVDELFTQCSNRWWQAATAKGRIGSARPSTGGSCTRRLSSTNGPYVRTGLEKEVRSRFPLPLKCTASAVLRPLLPLDLKELLRSWCVNVR